jgi:polygalacturonase
MPLTKATYAMIKGAVFNVLDYGAVGDGVTEDTSAFDAAIAAAAVGGGTVFVPSGTYYVDRIEMVSNVTLMGEIDSVLKRKGNIIVGVAYDLAVVDNVRIENIAFDDNAPSGPSAIWKFCVYIADATNVTFKNCYFYNGYDVAIKDLGPDGIYISTGSLGRNDILIQNCVFEQFTRNGISITNGANGVTVQGCTFKDCGLFGIDVEADAGDAIYARDIVVENCNFINNGDIALRAGEITATGGLNFVAPNPITSYHSLNVRVSECYFKTVTATNITGITYLSISSTYNMIVTDCIFDVPDTASDHWVMFDSGSYESANGIVANNIFRVKVQCYAFNDLKLTGNTFEGSLAYLLMANQGNGKTVSNNSFINSGGASNPCIQAYSLNLKIVQNSFKDSRALGVAPATVLQLTSPTSKTSLFSLNALISDNHAIGAYGAFVDLTGGSSSYGLQNIKFMGNKISGSDYGIRFNSSAARPNSFRITIENNTFEDTGKSALYLAKITGLKVDGNSFFNCATNSDVILLSECSNYTASNNLVNDTRSGAARAVYAIKASGNPTASALLSANLNLNLQTGYDIDAGEGTSVNNTSY